TPLISIHRGGATFCLKEIVSDDSLKFGVQAIKFYFMRGEASSRKMLASRLFAYRAAQPVELRGDLSKFFIARFAKCRDDLLVGSAFDRISAEHSSFATC